MYKSKPDMEAMRKQPTDPRIGRVEPDRKWFGNTRVLDQKELDSYAKALEDSLTKKSSGHMIMIKGRKLPIKLL